MKHIDELKICVAYIMETFDQFMATCFGEEDTADLRRLNNTISQLVCFFLMLFEICVNVIN